MEDHETRRKIIRQWMALPKNQRQTAEQAAAFAKRAIKENELQRSRCDPYDKILGWLLPRAGRP
jgi:hypothetical protein